jgi:hypothetical protein
MFGSERHGRRRIGESESGYHPDRRPGVIPKRASYKPCWGRLARSSARPDDSGYQIDGAAVDVAILVKTVDSACRYRAASREGHVRTGGGACQMTEVEAPLARDSLQLVVVFLRCSLRSAAGST